MLYELHKIFSLECQMTTLRYFPKILWIVFFFNFTVSNKLNAELNGVKILPEKVAQLQI